MDDWRATLISKWNIGSATHSEAVRFDRKVTKKAIKTYCQILKDVDINSNNGEKWFWILQFIMK